MNWLTNFVKPKIRALVGNNVPDNLWGKCPECEQMIFYKELESNYKVCSRCGNHMRLSVDSRIKLLFDSGEFSKIKYQSKVQDPLKFKDTKRYVDRLKSSRKNNDEDAVVVGYGRINGHKTAAVFFDFDFMGGSMGTAVGEGFLAGADFAASKGYSFLVVPCSGGARMQEGIFSLMQMPRTIIAIDKIKEAELPYIVLLTNPTTGGVSASFAMLGDIHIAEPGATIAFSGSRVIEGTIHEKLPKGFQKSEYLLSHGMIDMVVHRKELKTTISKIIGLLTHKNWKNQEYSTSKKERPPLERH
ncbi:MAG: acetyl-CoA carboxylase, carboxyltransferase subunit beta [Holosporaceae bacterium]|jgi:acetyl-CoA carboxylase carboxyl transferase subunit beta|nr:acetyl-CoA carboxylase, carboxyltransferase subunit beta [Holosporaceae bacterium]